MASSNPSGGEFVRIGQGAPGGSASNYVDPFTGGGRYVPGSGNSSASNGGGKRPWFLTNCNSVYHFFTVWTFWNRLLCFEDYTITFVLGDPLTSSGRYIPSGETAYTGKVDKKRPRNEFVPIRQFYQFGTEFSSQKIIPKLREMNEMQPTELKLSEEQVAIFDRNLKIFVN